MPKAAKDFREVAPLNGGPAAKGWRHPIGGRLASMEWSGVLGAGTPPRSKGEGRTKSHLRVFNRRYDCMAHAGSMPMLVPRAEGMQRGRASGSPCQDCAVIQHTSCGQRQMPSVLKLWLFWTFRLRFIGFKFALLNILTPRFH